MLIPQSVPAFAVSNAVATSPANRVLAASTTVNRYIKGIFATNTTSSAITLNIGIGVAATLTAANADVCFGLSIPANAGSYPVVQYPSTAQGPGRKALGVGSLNEIMAFASNTGILLNVIYADDSLQ